MKAILYLFVPLFLIAQVSDHVGTLRTIPITTAQLGYTGTGALAVSANAPGAFGHCAAWIADGNLGDSGGPCQTGGGAIGTPTSAITSGLLSARPVTLGSPQLYLATDQAAGSALSMWTGTQWLIVAGIDSSGSLIYTNGSLGINPAVVPFLSATETVTGLYTFSQGNIKRPIHFASVMNSCNAATEGWEVSVVDADTSAIQAVVTAVGITHAAIRCNGKSWTVLGS